MTRTQEVTNLMNAIATMFETTDKNKVASIAINTLVEKCGYAVDVAYEMVFGKGSYKKMAGMVYDSLVAKA